MRPLTKSRRQAVASRRLQFRAGPGDYTFFACADCLPHLEHGDVSLFIAIRDEPVQPVDPDDEIDCDLCWEP